MYVERGTGTQGYFQVTMTGFTIDFISLHSLSRVILCIHSVSQKWPGNKTKGSWDKAFLLFNLLLKSHSRNPLNTSLLGEGIKKFINSSEVWGQDENHGTAVKKGVTLVVEIPTPVPCSTAGASWLLVLSQVPVPQSCCTQSAHKAPSLPGRGVEFVWGPASFTLPLALPGAEHKHAGAEAAAQAAGSNSAGFVGLGKAGKPALRKKDFQSVPEHPCSFQVLRPCDAGRKKHASAINSAPSPGVRKALWSC